MSDNNIIYSQQIPDNKLQARIFTNFALADGIYLLVCAAVGYLAYRVEVVLVFLVLIITIVMFIRFPGGVGRLYREVWLELQGNFIEGFLGGILWQADESKREKRFAKYLRGRRSAIPVELTQIRAVIDGKLERFGLLQQLDRPYDQIFIRADGGNFANMDNSAESRAVNLLASVTNSSILQREDIKVGLSYVSITTPSNPYKIVGDLRVKIDPFIQFPEKFALSEKDKKYVEWQLANINQWQPVITQMGGAKSWQLIVVTIKRSWTVRLRRRTGRFNNQELTNLPIIELGRTLVDDLSNATSLGLKNVHCLGLAELAEVFRVGWGPYGINQYFQDKAKGLIPTTDDEIDRFREANKGKRNAAAMLDAYLQAFPKRIVKIHRKDKCVQYDENFVSVIRITQLPQSMRADQFRELLYRFSKYGWLRRSMVAEAVSSDKETRQQLIGQSALMNIESAMNSKKIVQDPRLATRRRNKQNQTNIIAAQSIAQLFNYLWPIVTPDQVSAKRAQRQVIGLLRSAGFKAKVVSQPALFVDASISGLYGANRL